MEANKNQNDSEGELDIDSHSLASNRNWIIVLLVILIGANILVFVVYNQSHPDESVWTQLWTYFTTEPFKILTISLVLPLITLFLENLFSLRTVVGERLHDMKKAQYEKKEEKKKKELEIRSKCIKKTIKAFNKLFSQIGEVVYFRDVHDGSSEKVSIENILMRIEETSLLFNELMNTWHFKFTNLRHSKREENLTDYVCYFLNLLTNSTYTIADHIQESTDPSDVKDLQNTLSLITCSVRSILYHNTVTILKCSADMWESAFEKKYEKFGSAENTLNTKLDNLKRCTKWMRDEELDHYVVLEKDKSNEAESFRKAIKNVEKFAVKNPPETVNESDEYLDCTEKYNKIDPKGLVRCHRWYSLDWVKHISEVLRSQVMLSYVLDRAKWVHEKSKTTT